MTLIPKLHYKVYGGKFEKVMKKVGRRLLYEGRKWREERAFIHRRTDIRDIRNNFFSKYKYGSRNLEFKGKKMKIL